jgi:hypothetical protein
MENITAISNLFTLIYLQEALIMVSVFLGTQLCLKMKLNKLTKILGVILVPLVDLTPQLISSIDSTWHTLVCK